MATKKKLTYSIDDEVAKDFKIECIHQGVEMSSAIESYMISFTNASKQSRIKENG